MIEKKFVKHCEIGELKFDIALNRAMAIKAFEQFPEYWEALSKSEALKEIVANENIDNNDENSEITAKDIKRSLELMRIAEVIEECSEKIVNYLLKDMLVFAETPLPDGIGCYDNYSLKILEYCNENNVLYNYIVEEIDDETDEVISSEEHAGFYTKAMEFITKAFTDGEKKKKSAVKIIMN